MLPMMQLICVGVDEHSEGEIMAAFNTSMVTVTAKAVPGPLFLTTSVTSF
jgi:hypothetical protein